MTRTEEILALADNTIKADNIRPKGKSILSVRLIEPETIKQLVELVRLQHETLLELEPYIPAKVSAIEAFNNFERNL